MDSISHIGSSMNDGVFQPMRLPLWPISNNTLSGNSTDNVKIFMPLMMPTHCSMVTWVMPCTIESGPVFCLLLRVSSDYALPITAKVTEVTCPVKDQSHRYGRPQAACREPAGSYDKTTRTAICFEHKTQHLLIHAPYTRIVVFWHIMILQSQISCNTHTFYIAAIFVKYCYTTGSWLL